MTTTSLNIFNYLIPLLITPYFVRISGVENYGHLTIASTIVQYYFLFVGFNLDIFGTAEIAVLKDDQKKSSILFWQLFHARILLFIIATLLFIPVLCWFYYTEKDIFLLAVTYLGLLGYTITPLWFYQGVEEFSRLFIGIAVGKLLFAVIILLFVHEPADYWYFNLGISLSHIITGLFLTIGAIRLFKLTYHAFQLKESLQFLKNKFSLFRGGTILQFNYNFNITLLSILLPLQAFGIFMAANKLVLVAYSMVALPSTKAFSPTFHVA
ncbi:oligosaccharide flippase family protein, partial [Flavihumibacter sp. CACIAM 22H1]|uniref:oligosaccharide flippase family protein n=1 Tax=Flavihumibacter sp. CACIAM 22H1 TaxID=1812911 RepID=UPI0025C22137